MFLFFIFFRAAVSKPHTGTQEGVSDRSVNYRFIWGCIAIYIRLQGIHYRPWSRCVLKMDSGQSKVEKPQQFGLDLTLVWRNWGKRYNFRCTEGYLVKKIAQIVAPRELGVHESLGF